MALVQIVLLEYCTFFTSKKLLLHYNIVFIHFDWLGKINRSGKLRYFLNLLSSNVNRSLILQTWDVMQGETVPILC